MEATLAFNKLTMVFSEPQLIKANHLAYIESRWYVRRISAECQQK